MSPTAREIKQAVTERYGALARGASGAPEAAAEACCTPAAPESRGPQTLELIAGDDLAACGPACCGEGAEPLEFGAALYAAEQLDELPDAARLASAGCGNPVAIAELRPGEAVLDLGSGGGIDCFLATKQVGPEGAVWGLDMTPDMIQLARQNAERVGASNVRFRLGEIEDMPFAGATFDVVISNCVINLSPDKPQVFREAFRVLKPGGRVRVSDIVLTADLPKESRADLEAWAGCVTGALPLDEYLGAVRAAGFVDVTAEYERDNEGIASAYVSATRPA